MSSTAEDLYRKRIMERQSFLDEAFRSAKVTIPSLIPDNQDIIDRNATLILEKPFQSLGARGVNNLASKLLLTLLPPTSPFMKYELTGETREQAEDSGEILAKLRAKLARREMRIQAEVDLQGIRTKGFSILKHLLVAGNVLAYMDPIEGGLQVYPLNSFTVKRDGKGTLLDLIYVEKLDRMSIDDERVLKILNDTPDTQSNDDPDDPKPVLLFTRVMRDGKNRYVSWQEVNSIKVPGSEDTHKKETLPWLVLRYTSIDGEDYGRGFVEEYRGDLTSYEQMSRDMQFASANAAKVVWAISPNSPVKFDKFADTPNGGGISAEKDDITAIRLDKGGDMQVVQVELRALQQALAADFMLNSSFQRTQERVTAEEIRRMAEELEDTLGGVFSLLSQELQLPLALLLEASLIRSDKTFLKLPEGSVRIGVVTGLAAIGRGQDLNRLRAGIELVAEVEQAVQGVAAFVNPENLSIRIWTGSGVDTDGLLFTGDEVKQQQEDAQKVEAAKVLGEELAAGAGTATGNLDPEVIAKGLAQQGVPAP